MDDISNTTTAGNSPILILLFIPLSFCVTILINYFFFQQINKKQHKESIYETNKGVKETIDGYNGLFTGARRDIGKISLEHSIDKRKEDYQNMVDSFYNLVTDFYEWGWGQSFHFAPRLKGEEFVHSITRAEYYLALRAGMKPNDKVLDVGCGVGGPMRNISQFTGANVTGVTINEFQVTIGNNYNQSCGLDDKCKLVQGDFQNLKSKFDENTFDSAFSCEATCHSPDRVECFSGVFHSLKPGGTFVGYEWVMLPDRGYDDTNPNHLRIKEGIEIGNGLPTLTDPTAVLEALEKAGFEIIDSFDANQNMLSPHEIPWYQSLKGSWSFNGFRMTRLGRICTHCLVFILESCRLAPSGSTKVSSLLNATALDLVESGEQQIFTPSYFFLARKPRD